MQLFTEEQFTKLCDNGRAGNHGQDWQPMAKLVLPGTGCAWLLSEIVRRNGRLYGYGLSDYGTGCVKEGFIDLSVLELMSDPLQRFHVRPDPSFIPRQCLSVYRAAAFIEGGITDDPEVLQHAASLNAQACQMLHSVSAQHSTLPP